MALDISTFENKAQLVENYMSQMKATLTEGYFTDNQVKEKLNPIELRLEQSRCEMALHQGVSHIAPSQIEDMLEKADIDSNTIDTQTYHQLDRLYIHKKIAMLESLIQTIDPKHYHNHPVSNTSVTSTPKLTGITFGQLYETIFLKEKRQIAPQTSPTTWRDYEAAYNDFIYVIEGAEKRDIASFTREDFRTFSDAIHSMPASRTKKPEYRTLPYSKLQELDIPDTLKMASNTKQKKLSSIKQIFDIACDAKYAYLQENLAAPFTLKPTRQNKKSNLTREPLTRDNLTKLYTSPIYTDQKEKLLSKSPEKYWIPLIALYSGMRQNEICQLYCNDIKSETFDDRQTIHYFDINDHHDKHLKNANATRKVPIHPKLIELGLLDYLNSTQSRHERLWPNLRLHPTELRYNSDYNKTFMKYFRKHVTDDPTQVFHSLRHNVGDQVIKATVNHQLPKALVNQLMGHEPDSDETSRTYSKGYGIKELFEGIRVISFQI